MKILIVYIFLTLVCIKDLIDFEISDWMIFAGMLIGFHYNGFAAIGFAAIVWFSLAFLTWKGLKLGGGDVKLAAALSAIIGVIPVLLILLISIPLGKAYLYWKKRQFTAFSPMMLIALFIVNVLRVV